MRLAALLVTIAACGSSARDVPDASPSADANVPDAAIDVRGLTHIYANTFGALYRVDPDTLAVTKVADFSWPVDSQSILDIAIDKNGLMVGIGYGSQTYGLYRIDPATARLTLLSNGLTEFLTGLSFVPASMIGQTGEDILVGTRPADGLVFRITATTSELTVAGDMGDFRSRGDLVSVANFGTVQMAVGLPPNSPDRPVRLAPPGFAGTTIGPATGFSQVNGLAYWKNRIVGFTYAGEIIEIDPASGKGTVVQSTGLDWFGAAVTTVAPLL